MKVPTKLDQNPHIPRWFSKSGSLLWLWSTFVTICKKNYKCQKDKNWKCSQSQSFWATDFLLCRKFYCDPMKVPTKLEQNLKIFIFFQQFWDFSILGQTNLAMGVTLIVNENASFGLGFMANTTEQEDFIFLAIRDAIWVFKTGFWKCNVLGL